MYEYIQCVCVCVCVSIYVCIYIYIYIYTHTHIFDMTFFSASSVKIQFNATNALPHSYNKHKIYLCA